MRDGGADLRADFKIGIFERDQQMLFDALITMIEHLQGLHNISPDEGNLFKIAPETAPDEIRRGSVNEHVQQGGDLFMIMGETDQFHSQVAILPILAG